MSQDIRKLILLIILVTLTGCNRFTPAWQMRQAQLRTYEMYHAKQLVAGQRDQLAAESAQLKQSLAIANERIQNLALERSQLQDQYKTMLTNAADHPLSGSAALRFKELSEKYPEFQFDPATGVSKFTGDLIFATGSDEIQPAGFHVLQEFAAIMNSSDARDFNIVVVGHTDDRPVVKAATKARHDTNWELSAHRATAVVKSLGKYGLSEPRMSIAGYSMYQPAVPNTSDSTRQQNRRVEIFIVAPDQDIAARSPQIPR